MVWSSEIQLKPKIAGVVVLYRPDVNAINNIRSYLDDICVLYVVDNSETVHKEIVDKFLRLEKIAYLHYGENLGIARALNIAASKAIEDGYDFLLTMDQDSCASSRMVSLMLDSVNDKDISRIGIIGPFHVTEFDKKVAGFENFEVIDFTMTSGNLLNLGVYQVVGPFLDELFIDFVDIEYCLRLMQKGYLVVQANRATLKHNLGNITQVKFFNKQLRTSNHPPLRRYYMTRNRFFIWKKYRDFEGATQAIVNDKACFWGQLRNIMLMEKDKIAKLVMIVKGYLDYKRNVFGKYRD
jgi:rhamnosyltransferase